MNKKDRKAWERELKVPNKSRVKTPVLTGSKFWPIIPRPAPRQSERDKFDPSPMVLRYRAFCREVQLRRVWLPLPGDLVVFLMPIPKSWTKTKRLKANGQPHEQVPDVDNLLKALLDASYESDAHIWAITPAKVWSSTPGIYIERREIPIRIPFKLIVL